LQADSNKAIANKTINVRAINMMLV
jgi:hypothetical protein